MKNLYRQPSSANGKKQNDTPSDEKKPPEQVRSQIQKKPAEVKFDMRNINVTIPVISKDYDYSVSEDRLQEAIIWSEILGKPVSRRRKRR